jgi:hypothetical protein
MKKIQDKDSCEISGSHGGEYEVWICQHLLDYRAVHPRRL